MQEVTAACVNLWINVSEVLSTAAFWNIKSINLLIKLTREKRHHEMACGPFGNIKFKIYS